MNRFGLLVPILVAACGEDLVCPILMSECQTGCVNLDTDPNNCGRCQNACGTAERCVVGSCQPMCEDPQVACGDACVDTQTSAAHCGACDAACPADTPCATGRCAVPLALLRTSVDDRTTDLDLYLLRDVTLDLAKLNTATFATDRVIDHAILPDGSLVIVAAQDAEGVFELFHVARGGAVTKLNPPLVAGGSVAPGIAISRDGTTVLYRADQDTDEVVDLYALDLALPGASVRVNDPGTPQELVVSPTGLQRVTRVFAVSADGNRVAYVADQNTPGIDEVFVVDLSGATPSPSVVVGPPAPAGVLDMRMTDDGTRVAIRADLGIGEQLHVVDLATPGEFATIGNTEEPDYRVDNYTFTADGGAIIYSGSDQTFGGALWHVPLATPPFDSTRLAGGFFGKSFQGMVRPDFKLSPDGTRVFYRADDFGQGDTLFVIALATPLEPVQLSLLADVPENQVNDFVLSRDGNSLVYRAGGDGAEGGLGFPPLTDEPEVDRSTTPAIFHLDLAQAAPTPTLLNPPLGGKGQQGIAASYIATDDRRVIYLADHDTFGSSEAYLVGVAAPQETVKVSPPLDAATGNDVSIVTRF